VKLFGEDTEHTARLVSKNEMYDLALVSVGGTDRPHLRLADPESVSVGDDVIAMGNPFGLATSVTTGVISSIRKLEDFPGTEALGLTSTQKKFNFIQTDAAINSGNSGGPLLNTRGRIIGLNSFGISKKLAEGLNFALHAKEIKKVYSHYFE
jgi:serine protease Do